MGRLDNYKPEMAMLCLQFFYAVQTLIGRVALVQGMSPTVFVVYRQAIATFAIAPVAYLARRKSGGTCIGLKSFSLIFLASLIGITINQNLYFKGLYFASSTMAAATANVVPAITFIVASLTGFEKINIRSIRTVAKILGTLACVSGAVSMALFRGPKLLNEFFFGSGRENWLLGCMFLFTSACSWSLWLILQVPVTTSYPDHLSLSAWTCFMATLQSAVFALFTEQDPGAWTLNSFLEFVCCLYTGVIGSGLAFFLQAWCISQRGPLFSAMFNPLCTVIVTVLAALFLHEEIYAGSLIGGVGVIIGLYVVLWGKAQDFVKNEEDINPKQEIDPTQIIKVVIDESTDQERKCKIDLEEPLLSDKSNDFDTNHTTQ